MAHKNNLAKQVYLHKMQIVATSNDEKKVSQEYQKFKKKQSRVLSICEKKMQEVEEQDYLQIRESKSTSDLGSEEEIKVQHVQPIGENTIPPYIQGRLVDTNPLIKKEQGLWKML